jgi:RNA polymerase sigma-70 factor (ECF subfamily)
MQTNQARTMQQYQTRLLSKAMQDSILAAAPGLRSFAISLCGNADRADDLVQETLLRAIDNIDSFQPGTNLFGWLATILRNQFLTEFRKRRNEVEDVDGQYVDTLTSIPDQESHVEFEDFRTAFAMLPPDQQEALLLVGALGLSYGEAAIVCGIPIGTIRGRIHRARMQLSRLFAIGQPDESGPMADTWSRLS